jgi:hypothetical protein
MKELRAHVDKNKILIAQVMLANEMSIAGWRSPSCRALKADFEQVPRLGIDPLPWRMRIAREIRRLSLHEAGAFE